jgi:hypothetical protein
MADLRYGRRWVFLVFGVVAFERLLAPLQMEICEVLLWLFGFLSSR